MAEYCEHCMQPVTGSSSCPFCGSSVHGNANENWQLQPGTILHQRYLLGRVLGAGGFGITYIGMDLRLSRRVAVKEYFPVSCAHRVSEYSPVVTITDSQSDFACKGKEDFIREARILAALPRTPGIVEVYDFFEDNDTAYIVMEYLDGHTLKHMLSSHRFSTDEIFNLMKPVLEALEVVHDNKLVHRDISPDNLMLCKGGKLVLMDFGSARQINFDDPKSMTLVIKRGYAPEEQYRSHGEVGPWTDIYALCATIYHCITGLAPEESVERLIDENMHWPSELGIVITSEQEAVLKKGMAVRARDRYRAVRELREALCQQKTETDKNPMQPHVNQTLPGVNLKESSWQQMPSSSQTTATPIPEPNVLAGTMLPREKEREQAGIRRIPVKPSASEAQLQTRKPIAVSAEASEAASVPDSKQSSIKLGKLIALVVAVTLVLCVGIVVTFFAVSSKRNLAEETDHIEMTSVGSDLSNPTVISDSVLDAGQKVTWDCIRFGAYPQAEVVSTMSIMTSAIDESCLKDDDYIVDATLYAQLQSATGWDSKNEIIIDGSKYRRMLEADATYTCSDSSYYNWNDSTTYHYFKYQPIKWRVLRIEGSMALVLADACIDVIMWNADDSYGNTWESSQMRSWLNGYGASSNHSAIDYSGNIGINFIDSAFTATEQTAIVNGVVQNNITGNDNDGSGASTTDRIFLLSYAEVGNSDYGFISDHAIYDNARRSLSSTYARARGVWLSPNSPFVGNSYWWLRSAGTASSNACHVSFHGKAFYKEYGHVISNDCGVRPALRIDLSSTCWDYAGKVSSDGTVHE